MPSELLQEVSILVHWESSDFTIEGVDPLLQTPLEDQIREEDGRIRFPPLPPLTPLQTRWITLRELAEKDAYVISLETHHRVPITAPLGWHWSPNPVVVTKKPTEHRNSVVNIPSTVPAVVGLNPMTMPVVVMALDTSTFFIGNTEEEGLYEATSSHLSLSITLHADLMLHAPVPTSLLQSTAGNKTTDVQSNDDFELIEDVVLVLQELRDDEEEPLVMRVELPRRAALPITRTTFHIPAARLPAPSNCKNQFKFWVRLLSKASILVSFHSIVGITVGLQECDIYQTCCTNCKLCFFIFLR